MSICRRCRRRECIANIDRTRYNGVRTVICRIENLWVEYMSHVVHDMVSVSHFQS